MIIEFHRGNIFEKTDYSFVKLVDDKKKLLKIKDTLTVCPHVAFGIYKKPLFGKKRWIFNVTDFELGLLEIIPHLNSNCIRHLAIDITKLKNKTQEEIRNILKEIFKNNTIKIKCFESEKNAKQINKVTLETN